MVKNLTKRIFSIRFLRVFVLLLICATVTLTMVTPASAVITVEGVQRYYSPMAGTVDIYSAASGAYEGKNFVVSAELPRSYPSLSNYGVNYYVEIAKHMFDYAPALESTDSTKGYYLHHSVKRVEGISINNYRYDRIINMFTAEDSDGSDDLIGKVVFNFDPFAFNFDPTFLHQLIRFRTFETLVSSAPDWEINLTGKVWYVNSDNKLTYYTFNWDLTCGPDGKPFTQGIFTNNYCNAFLQKCNLQLNQPVLFTDLVVTANMIPYGTAYQRFGSFGYDILTENYVGGTPLFARDAVQWFNSQIQSSINKAEWDKDIGHLVTPDSAALASSSFGEFLIAAAVGVFDSEIVPGITLGGILVSLLMLGLVIGVIKIFK